MWICKVHPIYPCIHNRRNKLSSVAPSYLEYSLTTQNILTLTQKNLASYRKPCRKLHGYWGFIASAGCVITTSVSPKYIKCLQTFSSNPEVKMAIIKCPDCSVNVSDKAASCPSCGYPISKLFNHSPRSSNNQYRSPREVERQAITPPKSRGTHIILGLLFGGLGFHNFYSGHNLRGGIKIGLFLLAIFLDAATGFNTAFFLVAAVISGIWALCEIMFVNRDASGNAMT